MQYVATALAGIDWSAHLGATWTWVNASWIWLGILADLAENLQAGIHPHRSSWMGRGPGVPCDTRVCAAEYFLGLVYCGLGSRECYHVADFVCGWAATERTYDIIFGSHGDCRSVHELDGSSTQRCPGFYCFRRAACFAADGGCEPIDRSGVPCHSFRCQDVWRSFEFCDAHACYCPAPTNNLASPYRACIAAVLDGGLVMKSWMPQAQRRIHSATDLPWKRWTYFVFGTQGTSPWQHWLTQEASHLGHDDELDSRHGGM